MYLPSKSGTVVLTVLLLLLVAQPGAVTLLPAAAEVDGVNPRGASAAGLFLAATEQRRRVRETDRRRAVLETERREAVHETSDRRTVKETSPRRTVHETEPRRRGETTPRERVE